MSRSTRYTVLSLLLVLLSPVALRADLITLDDLGWDDLGAPPSAAPAADLFSSSSSLSSSSHSPSASPSDSSSSSSPSGSSPSATASADVRIYEPSRPFVIGRDNLGFANPSGAVTCASMSGNCYTMAVVAKFFWESARFDGDASGRGFDEADMVRVLEAGPGTSATFPVKGYESLWDMTHVDGVSGYTLSGWMEERTRQALGLRDEAPGMADPANADILVQLYKIISTIHYLHYQQFQVASVIELVVRHQQQGGTSAKQVTLETLEAMKTSLRRDDLPLLTILNPVQVYGHTVLAYRIVETADHADVYFYDNNDQHGDRLDETFFRIARDGGFEGWKKSAETGAESVDRGWEGATFWDPTVQSLIVFPDLNHDRERRLELARKLSVTDEETAYLLASGDFLRQLTEKGPGEVTLLENMRSLVRTIQNVQEATGTRPSWRREDLAADADAAALNAYLERYGSRAVEEICPYALPEGLRLSRTRLRFDETDPNRARLEARVTITKDDAIDDVLKAIRSSVLSEDDPTLANLVEGLSKSFEGERIVSDLSVDLVKGEFPVQKIGRYGPVPTLRRSHTVVGNIEPGSREGDDSDHRIEIAEELAKKLLNEALEAEGVLNHEYAFDYGFDLPLWGRVNRRGTLTLNAADLDFRPGSLVLSGGFHCFAPVLTSSRGVNVSSRFTGVSCAFRRTRKNVFRLSGAAGGSLTVSAGMGMLDGVVFDALGALFGKVFPFFAGKVEDFVEGKMADYVALPAGSSIAFRSVSVSSRSVSAGLRPFEVDFAKTVEKLFGRRAPVELRDVRFGHDRMVLLTSNDG